MYKIVRLSVSILLIGNIMACSNLAKNEPSFSGEKQWDFDHEVQFTEKRISPNQYRLRAFQMNKVPFERLASFLLRRSLIICQSYNYKIEILQGVEEFDEKLGSPNKILKDLSANLECSIS